jgi:hypothetical protein
MIGYQKFDGIVSPSIRTLVVASQARGLRCVEGPVTGSPLGYIKRLGTSTVTIQEHRPRELEGI